jgi:hypothetical protein
MMPEAVKTRILTDGPWWFKHTSKTKLHKHLVLREYEDKFQVSSIWLVHIHKTERLLFTSKKYWTGKNSEFVLLTFIRSHLRASDNIMPKREKKVTWVSGNSPKPKWLQGWGSQTSQNYIHNRQWTASSQVPAAQSQALGLLCCRCLSYIVTGLQGLHCLNFQEVLLFPQYNMQEFTPPWH